ncbi:hypothetical protein T11_8066, partial [Trichinella zimbabwensis]
MVLAFVYQCAERSDCGCLAYSPFYGEKTTQSAGISLPCCPQLAAVRSECTTSSRFSVTVIRHPVRWCKPYS